MQSLKPFLLLIGLVLLGLAVTAALSSFLDSRVVDQEIQRERAYQAEQR